MHGATIRSTHVYIYIYIYIYVHYRNGLEYARFKICATQ